MNNEWKRNNGHLVPLVMLVILIVLWASCSELQGWNLHADNDGVRIDRNAR